MLAIVILICDFLQIKDSIHSSMSHKMSVYSVNDTTMDNVQSYVGEFFLFKYSSSTNKNFIFEFLKIIERTFCTVYTVTFLKIQ